MRYKIIGILLLALFFTACGEDETLSAYLEDMNTFFSRAAEYNEKMNAIDRDSATALPELLGYLDALEEDIAWMAELEVPEQFSAAESLADEAAENMQQAVGLFHKACEGEQFDDAAAQAAIEYYNRTNIRIQYIITILHGEIPEGEGVTYTEENTFLGGGYLNKQDKDDQDTEEDDTVFYMDPSEGQAE